MSQYQLVAIGDSVVWGQGVRDTNKYVGLVHSYLKKFMAKHGAAGGVTSVPHIRNFAHSGAVSRGISAANDEFPGEIPNSWPSVELQVSRLSDPDVLPNPADVRLIIMNGGANDLRLFDIIDPNNTIEAIKERAEDICYGVMKGNVGRALSLCPNAQIIITGYYQAISQHTKIGNDCLEAFVINAFGVAKGPDLLAALHAAMSDPSQAQVWKTAMVNNGLAFKTASDEAFVRLARDLNGELALAGDGQRVHFAPSGFNEWNAGFTGPNSYIWEPVNAVPAYPADEMINRRKPLCENLASTHPGFGGPDLCIRAAIGHPNVEGHLCYFRSILTVLDDVLRNQGFPA